MKQFLNTYPKLKNPYFYLSVIALIFSASGVDGIKGKEDK